MTKQMLIDAAHAEEVRVCVLENGKVEDFDFELSARKPLRGNIYLARVTRVEPSLQAAFVEYGGNRHGFLAFNEIHPDYYQIPVSDRRLLQEAEAEEAALAAELELEQRGDDRAAAEDDFDFQDDSNGDSDHDGEDENAKLSEEFGDKIAGETDEAQLETAPQPEISEPASEDETSQMAENVAETKNEAEASADDEAEAEIEDDTSGKKGKRTKRADRRNDVLERYKEARRKRARLLRNYKIQEVIKRRQILLVQVVKEERGNKGAALTTYLSLAGRYCVLMPNTARGGGISRKIAGPADRKRLKRIVDGLDVPQGTGLIIRTAGAKRTKAEIKRDYDYLTRLWENIRTLTLKSIAPCLIYEEASLIKRAIRDLYDKDIKVVLVEGDAGYREAKDFMKMLMPSHAKNVQPYKEKTPLFLKYAVENQLDAMYNPTVRLKSGGYLVIHQTEALVAIDVNSGKSTRERNIELTALKTNIEAAREAARQCRLRDLAGLIVIDFIDMMENRNNRSVEKALKDALKSDRARIQVGRISNFGLLEMSRQRRRSSLVEGTTHVCPTCDGAGTVRSNEMAALRILRAIESEALSGRAGVIRAKTSLDVALYMLNHKREWLKRIEEDYALSIEVVADETKASDHYEIEKYGAPREISETKPAIRPDLAEFSQEAENAEQGAENPEQETSAEEDGMTAKKRRRRRRPRREDVESGETAASTSDVDEERKNTADAVEAAADPDESQTSKKRRRRGRRGGKRNRRKTDSDRPAEPTPELGAQQAEGQKPSPDETVSAAADAEEPLAGATSEPTETGSERAAPPPESEIGDREEATPAESAKERSGNGHDAEGRGSEDVKPATEEPGPFQPETASEETPKRRPTRRGWWQRALGG